MEQSYYVLVYILFFFFKPSKCLKIHENVFHISTPLDVILRSLKLINETDVNIVQRPY